MKLFADEKFNAAITYGTNDTKKVRLRFEMALQNFEEILGAHTD